MYRVCYIVFITCFIEGTVVRVGHERMWLPVGMWAGPWKSKDPLPFPVLGAYIVSTVPTTMPEHNCCCVLKDTAFREHWLLRPSSWYRCLKPVNFINLKILVGKCGDLLILQLPETILIYQIPCLLNLPPATLEWPDPFLGLFMPSV